MGFKLVEIRLLTSLAGVEPLSAGQVIETNPEEAARMVEAGHAEYVEPIRTARSPEAAQRKTTHKKRKTDK